MDNFELAIRESGSDPDKGHAMRGMIMRAYLLGICRGRMECIVIFYVLFFIFIAYAVAIRFA
jgi:hypothetical protein